MNPIIGGAISTIMWVILFHMFRCFFDSEISFLTASLVWGICFIGTAVWIIFI